MTKKDTTAKADATPAEETASEEETEVTTEETTEETEVEPEEKSTSTDIDYEALEAEEQERAKNAPDPLKAKEAFKKRKEKESHEDEEELDEEDKPLTRRELKEALSGVTKQTQESQALQIALANTSSEAEAKAAITFWKTRVVPTGDLQADVLFAIGGLNHKKVISQTSELKRALKSKETASKDSASAHKDPMPGVGPKVSPQELESYKRGGFEYDNQSRLFKKKLPSGKILVKDPKTKKTYLA